MSAIDGFINLLKPPGMTSHDAVAKVRRIIGTRSVGHAGTLDPAAAGVLPLAVGKATRLLEYLADRSKVYIGEATFGVETDTLDQCGRVVRKSPADFSVVELERALTGLHGKQLQSPPAFSAVKHQGKRLYEYAREGELIALPGREIEIQQLRLLAHYPGEYPRCLFYLECSKGTYVRVLVQELAARLKTVGTMTFLLRQRVGAMTVGDAVTLEELSQDREAGQMTAHLLPSSIALQHLPSAALSEEATLGFVSGQAVDVTLTEVGLYAVYGLGRLLGIGELVGQALQPRKVLTSREDLR